MPLPHHSRRYGAVARWVKVEEYSPSVDLWCYRCGDRRTVLTTPPDEVEDGVPMRWACSVCGAHFTANGSTFVFGRLTPQPSDHAPPEGPGSGA